MKHLGLSSILLVGLALTGCGDRQNQNDASAKRLCTQEARSGMGILVTVPNGVSASQFANEVRGTVTVDNSAWELISSISQDGKTVSLYGAWEATGSLTVAVHYRTASGRLDNVAVESDGCHTKGATLTATISGNDIPLARVR